MTIARKRLILLLHKVLHQYCYVVDNINLNVVRAHTHTHPTEAIQSQNPQTRDHPDQGGAFLDAALLLAAGPTGPPEPLVELELIVKAVADLDKASYQRNEYGRNREVQRECPPMPGARQQRALL